MSVIKFTATDGTTFAAKNDYSKRGCVDCEFDHNREVAGMCCDDAPACMSNDRPDGRDIIWIKEAKE